MPSSSPSPPSSLSKEEDEPHRRRHPMTSSTCGVLVVGNPCHDVLFLDGRVIGESLGGSTSFISSVLDPILPSSCTYVSKVGPDFPHHRLLPGHNNSPPIPSPFPTTLFHAFFSSSYSSSPSSKPSRSDRVLRRVRSCDPILPSDLPSLHHHRFLFGVAAGVAGEIPPATLSRMLDLCRVVFVDAQALVRAFDPADGAVTLVPLGETGFAGLLPRIAFLKASADEAGLVGVEEARWSCCVVVTRGGEGCRLYWKDVEVAVPAFPAPQVDPTGAGDSFLGGFIAGLAHGLNVADAALLGNFFGSLTVRQVGLRRFHPRVLQAVRDKLKQVSGSTLHFSSPKDSVDGFKLDEEFQMFLANLCKTAYDDGDYIPTEDGYDCGRSEQSARCNFDGTRVIPRENGCFDDSQLRS